jgi:hypothetical protein
MRFEKVLKAAAESAASAESAVAARVLEESALEENILK